MYAKFLALLGALVVCSSWAEDSPLEFPKFAESSVNVRIDGALDEPVWADLPYYDGMLVTSPATGEEPRFETHVRYFYTEKGLYVGAWNQQPEDMLLPRLTSRDTYSTRDSFSVTLDTSGQGRYGYWFQIALGNSMIDGVVLPERNFERDWDGPWQGSTKIVEGGWSAEIFLPWAMLNMPRQDGTRRMGLYVSRSIGKIHERWTNPYLPSTQPGFISQLQPVEFEDVNPRQEYSLYPFISSVVDGIGDHNRSRAGIDVFWRPSSYLRFSSTLNPDFGQVEADDVVVNFTAFETFFPEKRLFFLENRDVFETTPRKASNGTLLNTRRIGSSLSSRRGRPDDLEGASSFERNEPVDLLGALKATGQYGAIRYGVLAAFEDDTQLSLADANRVASGRDFGVARVTYEDTKSGGRRGLGWMGTATIHPLRDAFTQGIDAHLKSRDSRLQWDGQLFYSDVAGTQGVGGFADFELRPKTGHRHQLELEYFDKNIDLNDLGFLSRNDHMALDYDFDLTRSAYKNLREQRTTFRLKGSWNTDRLLTGASLYLRRRWNFLDNSQFAVAVSYKPDSWDDRNSLGNGDYKVNDRWQFDAAWNSDWALPFIFDLGIGISEESQPGLRQNYSGSIIIRPSDRWSLGFRARYTASDAWLIHLGDGSFGAFESEQWSPRLQMATFFTARQQLSLALEWVGIKAYESQRWQVPTGGGDLMPTTEADPVNFAVSDMTIQIRYRWELAPLSDLFVVYNRGGRLPAPGTEDDFGTLFSDALSTPSSEFLVVKLRYRIGPS